MNLNFKRCRICLTQQSSLLPIYGKTSELASKIFYCCQLQIIEFKHFDIPALICSFCLSELTSTESFLRKARKSQLFFKEILYEIEKKNWNPQAVIQEIKTEPLEGLLEDDEVSSIGSDEINTSDDDKALEEIEISVKNKLYSFDKNECNFCGKIFNDPTSKALHIRRIHRHKTHQCDLCYKSFKLKNDLTRHMSRVHTKESIGFSDAESDLEKASSLHYQTEHVICDQIKDESIENLIDVDENCEKVEASSQNKTEHLVENQCHICKRICSSEFAKRRHLRRVHCRKTHKCDVCFRKFKLKNCLTKHMAAVHYKTSKRRKKKVETENLTIEAMTDLPNKIKVESLEIISNEHSKNNCNTINGIVSSSEEELFDEEGLAKRYSEKDLEHQCHICKRVCSSAFAKKRHLHRVHRPKTIKCEICDKLFKSKDCISKHMAFVHGRKSKKKISNENSHQNQNQNVSPMETKNLTIEAITDLPNKIKVESLEIISIEHSKNSCDAINGIVSSSEEELFNEEGLAKTHSKDPKINENSLEKEFTVTNQQENQNQFFDIVKAETLEIITENDSILDKNESSNEYDEENNSNNEGSHNEETLSENIPKTEIKNQCHICKKICSSDFAWKRHLQRVHCPKSHKCVFCNRKFKIKNYLTKHLKRVHRNESINNVLDSNEHALNNGTLEDSSSEDEPIGTVENTCHICEKVCSNKTARARHIRRVHRPYDNECDVCGKFYKTVNDRNRHKARVHGGVPKLPKKFRIITDEDLFKEESIAMYCGICKKFFKTKGALRKHMKNLHESIDDNVFYICDCCGVTFTRKHRLTAHLKSRHLNLSAPKKKSQPIVMVPCEICGLMRTRGFMKMHMRTHKVFMPEDFWYCDVCGAKFKQKSTLSNHIKFMHIKRERVLCSLCPSTFKRTWQLKLHTKSKHNDFETRDFKCEICGKGFMEKEKLKIHTRIHTGEKPFACHLCDRKFTHKTDCRRHIWGHTGERPFKCEVPDCGRGFMKRSELLHHTNRCHS